MRVKFESGWKRYEFKVAMNDSIYLNDEKERKIEIDILKP